MNLLFNLVALFQNTTLRAEELVLNDISPSDWVYRALDAFNYLWQVKLIIFCFNRKRNFFVLVILALLYINIYLSSFNRWLSLCFTININTNILYCLYSWFSYSSNLAFVLSSNLYCRKAKLISKK